MRRTPILNSHTLLVLSAALLAFALLSASSAFATLGEDVSSVEADQAHLKTSVRVVANRLYSVHEMQTPAGTIIRQYASPEGTVFAVSWRGFSPDLRQLLGEHFHEYVAAASQKAHAGRGVHIETGDLVFESGGHMRYVVGRAFLRSKLPSGVGSDEIR
ncbi:MAG TPA: DUF2844 domain-containing protein [Terriglobales bacterium]|nr:DUF2844 domain-containing protein [Terriglobales bacterium]